MSALLATLLVVLSAKPPDKALTVELPGGGKVKRVVFGIRTFHNLLPLIGPVGGPVAGAELTADLGLSSEPMLLEGALYSSSGFSSSAEPYATLKKERLAAKAAPDGSRVAYSVDGEKTWRVLLVDPPAACSHQRWPSAAAALAVSAEDAAAAFLRASHPGNGAEGVGGGTRGSDADALEAVAWAMAHLSPRTAAAMGEWLAVPGNSRLLDHSSWRPSDLEYKQDDVSALRAAATADPKLLAKLLAAAKAEPPGDDDGAPSLLQHAAGLAPVVVGGLEPPEGGTVRVFARTDGGWDSTPTTEVKPVAGRYTLAGLAAGQWLFSFSAPGFATQTMERTVPFYRYTVQLRQAKPLSGTVKKADGTPVAGAAVVVSELPSSAGFPTARAEATTDAEGRFTIAAWTGGQFTVGATPKGSRHCFQWNLRGQQREALTLSLPAKPVRFKFTGAGSARMQVSLWPSMPFKFWPHLGCAERSGVTDASGAVAFDAPSAEEGTFRGRARRPDGSWFEFEAGDGLTIPLR